MMNRIIQKSRRYNRKSEEEKLTALIVENEDQQQDRDEGEVEVGRRETIAVSPGTLKEEKHQVGGGGGGEGDLTKITKNDTTKERRQKFKHSFDRNNVIMTVEKGDILMEKDDEDMDDSDLYQGSLILPRSSICTINYSLSSSSSSSPEGTRKEDIEHHHHQTTTAPNCCIICLDEYKPGDIVVWSCNPICQHAFHRACIIKYFIKSQKKIDGTPCPCCRNDFTDLEVEKRKRKRQRRRTIRTSTSSTFTFSAIWRSLRRE